MTNAAAPIPLTQFERLSDADYLKSLDEAQLQAEIAGLSQLTLDEKLSLLELWGEYLLLVVSGFPELILDEWDSRLAADHASQVETAALLQRLTTR